MSRAIHWKKTGQYIRAAETFLEAWLEFGDIDYEKALSAHDVKAALWHELFGGDSGLGPWVS